MLASDWRGSCRRVKWGQAIRGGDKIADLREVLDAHGVDTSSLQALHGEGEDTIYTLSTHGSKAIDLWKKLRGLVEETGYWPVVVGDDDSVAQHLTALEDDSDASAMDIIEESRSIDGESWLAEEYASMYDPDAAIGMAREFTKKSGMELPQGFYDALDARRTGKDDEDTYPRGDWPEDVTPPTGYEVPRHGTWLPNEQEMEYTWIPLVYVALVPTPISWEVPAYMKVGNWNACPEAQIHCAVFRYWGDSYGAEIVCMSNDTFEFDVARPPQDREAAIALAEEQYGYCDDIVEHGVGTLEALAATLLNGHIWLFSWD